MADYTFKSLDGREVTLRGERPPTEEDVRAVFASLPPKESVANEVTPKQTVGQRAVDLLAGNVKDKNPDYRPSPDAFGAPSDAGGGGVTFNEAQKANQVVSALAARTALPTAGFVLGGGAPGGAIGGAAGELLAKYFEEESPTAGGVTAATLLGAIPGAPAAAKGVLATVKEGVKQGGAGLLARTLETGIDQQRLPTKMEAGLSSVLPAVAGSVAQKVQSANPEIQEAVRGAVKTVEQKSYEAGAKLGLKAAGPAGKPPAVISNLLSHKNQPKINKASAVDLGLPEKTQITTTVIDRIRKEESAPYAEIKAIAQNAADKAAEIRRTRFTSSDPHDLAIAKSDPVTVAELAPLEIQAKADIDGLRKAREAMDNGMRGWKNNGDTKALETYENARELAEALEDQIQAAVASSGKPDLAKRLSAARQRIAKTYDYEYALNTSNADISAPALGALLGRKKPLSGNSLAIADFNNSFPYATREVERVMAPGITRPEALTTLLSVVGGVGSGAAVGHPVMGALAGLAPLTGPIKRQIVLSDAYQKMFPKYSAPQIDEDPLSVAIREFGQAAPKMAPPQSKTADKPPPLAPKKSAMNDENTPPFPTLTPKEAKAAPVGTKFVGTTGLTYEKMANGKIKQIA